MLTNPILYWFAIYLAVGLPMLVLLRLLGAMRTKLQPAGEMYRADHGHSMMLISFCWAAATLSLWALNRIRLMT